MEGHYRGCMCTDCQEIRRRRVARLEAETLEQRRRGYGHPFVNVAEDDHGGIQIFNINENDDRIRDEIHDSVRDSIHDHEQHDERIRRPRQERIIVRSRSASTDSGTTISTIELVPVGHHHGHRRHSSSHLRNSHDWHEANADSTARSGALSLASSNGHLYGRQIAEQTQNMIIRPEEWSGRRLPSPWNWDPNQPWVPTPPWGCYRPWDPYGLPKDHWKVEEEQLRARIHWEDKEFEDRVESRIYKYREEQEKRKNEITSAINQHDLDVAAEKAREKAAIDAAVNAALKKECEEQEKIKKDEDVNLDLYYRNRHGFWNDDTKIWLEYNDGQKCFKRKRGPRRTWAF